MSSMALQQKSSETGIPAAGSLSSSEGRLADKRALITGGDTDLGRAVAVAFAREGADIALVFQDNDAAAAIHRAVARLGRRCVLIRGDIGELDVCDHALEQTVERLGGLDILVNNAEEESLRPGEALRPETFSTFYLTRNALRFIEPGGVIINTAAGDDAIASFTRSLSQVVARRGIRVNAVAPSMTRELATADGDDLPLPQYAPHADAETAAPSYVFLASGEGGQMTGQILHPHGG
jgi:NAD(P)-dependent dehydrogenase (short-subunit alcohol dehydrogenase family)